MKKRIIISIIIISILCGAGFYFYKSHKEKESLNIIKEDIELQLGISSTEDENEETGLNIEYNPDTIYKIYDCLYKQIDLDIKTVDKDFLILSMNTIDLSKINKNMNQDDFLRYIQKDNVDKKHHEIKVKYTKEDNQYYIIKNEEFLKAIYYEYYDDYLDKLDSIKQQLGE